MTFQKRSRPNPHSLIDIDQGQLRLNSIRHVSTTLCVCDVVLSWLQTPTGSISVVVHHTSGWYFRLAQIVFMLRPMFCVCLASVICFRRLADQLTPFIQSVAPDPSKKRSPFSPFHTLSLSQPTDSLCTTLFTLKSTGLCPLQKLSRPQLSLKFTVFKDLWEPWIYVKDRHQS